MLHFFIIIIIAILCSLCTLAHRGGIAGGAPNTKWVALQNWDGSYLWDPLGCKWDLKSPILSKLDAVTNSTMNEPSPMIKGTNWNTIAYYLKPDVVLLLYYQSPCRVYRSIFVKQGSLYQPRVAEVLKDYNGGLTTSDVLESRMLLQQYAPELTNTDSEFAILPPVKEFEYKPLVSGGPWGIAPKINGRPIMVTVLGGKILMHMRNYVQFVGSCSPTEIHMCAGELLDKDIYVWDAMILDGRNITRLGYKDRVDKFPLMTKKMNDLLPSYSFKSQNWTWAEETHESWVSAIDTVWAMKDHLPTDGIVIQRSDLSYLNTEVYKFKTLEELTVDLMHLNNTFSSSKSGICHDEHFDIPAKAIQIPEVVEIELHTKKITRLRTDKTGPNSTGIVKQIRQHYDNETSISDIKGDTIQFLRAWMRIYESSNMYRSVKRGSTLLDIGAGNGRSSPNWEMLKLGVYAVEPDTDRFKELKHRYRKFKGVENWGGEDIRIQSLVPANGVDTVMMIHSLTFFFRDQATLDQLIANITHSLRSGGQFIGIGLDGGEVKKMLDYKGQIDCEAFNIRHLGDQKIEITMKGAKTLVQNQIEYLTDFPMLEKKLNSKGFKLQKTYMMPSHYILGEMPAWFANSTRIWHFIKN